MFILVIISLVSGGIVLEERGFRSEEMCEKRATKYIMKSNKDRYRAVCVRELQRNKPNSSPFHKRRGDM